MHEEADFNPGEAVPQSRVDRECVAACQALVEVLVALTGRGVTAGGVAAAARSNLR